MTTWHAPPEILHRFAVVPEALDEVTASSVEQHLVACADCRTQLAGGSTPAALDASWAAIVDIIDQPRTSVVERILIRLGMSGNLARVVGATPGMELAWLATVVLVAIGAVTIGRRNGNEGLFLAVAPVLPLGSVLLTFLPTEEPGGEAAAATPMYGAGIVLRRAAAALVPTFVVLALAGLALPDLTDGARWLLPSLALVSGSLALATYVRPVVALALTGAAWITVLSAVQVLDGRRVPLVHTATFGPAGQIVATSIALAAAALLYLRRDRFSTVEVTW